MKESLFKTLKFLAFLSIGLLLLFFAFKGTNPNLLWNDLKTAKYSWIFLSLLFALLAYFVRAWRWILIIEPLGYKPSFSITFYSMMTGYLANFALPRIGEITRCASLAKKENIPLDKLIGTVIVERIVDLLSLFVLLLFLLVMKFNTFGNFINNSILIPIKDKISTYLGFSWIIWIAILIIIALLFILYYLYFRETLGKFKAFNKFKNIIKGIISGLKTVYKMKRKPEFLVLSMILWVLYLLMTWVVFFSLPATSQLKIIDGVFILVIGTLGMTVPVQSGIGAFHWIVSRGLFAVYPNISLELGLVFATITHGSQAVFAIIVGSLSAFLLIKRKKSFNTLSNISPVNDTVNSNQP